MMRSSVVLPEPEGPSSASSSPARMSRLTPFSAGSRPKVFDDALDADRQVERSRVSGRARAASSPA